MELKGMRTDDSVLYVVSKLPNGGPECQQLGNEEWIIELVQLNCCQRFINLL